LSTYWNDKVYSVGMCCARCGVHFFDKPKIIFLRFTLHNNNCMRFKFYILETDARMINFYLAH